MRHRAAFFVVAAATTTGIVVACLPSEPAIVEWIPDGAIDAGQMCDANAPFSAPTEVDGISGAMPWARGVSLSPDERTIYFAGNPDGGPEDIWVATRTDRSRPFENAEVLSMVSLPTKNDTFPTISGDLRTLVFSRKDLGATPGAFDLFIARRDSAAEPFGTPTALSSVNSSALDTNAFLVPDGTEFWFESYRDAGAHRLFRAIGGPNFADASVFPVPLTGTLATPVLSADGKTLFYSGPNGERNNDIAEARRTSLDGGFTFVRWVEELNSSADSEHPAWLSPDGCRLYLRRAFGEPKTMMGVRAP